VNQPDDDRAQSAADYGGQPQPFQQKARATSRWRFIPLVESVRGYSVSMLRVDVLAGVALAALAVPQGMAYAQTAGLPVVAGL
jgi:SulP family sulfate permease